MCDGSLLCSTRVLAVWGMCEGSLLFSTRVSAVCGMCDGSLLCSTRVSAVCGMCSLCVLPEYRYARCDMDGHNVEPYVKGAVFFRQMVGTQHL